MFGAAAWLLTLIVIAALAGFGLRASVLRNPTVRALQAVDGLSAIAMGVVVIGLMSAVGPALTGEPLQLLAMLAATIGANLGLQMLVATACRRAGWTADAAALGIVAGNRNIALFLTVLPQNTIDPVLLFVGCYQIPMYLTPILLGWFYKTRPNPPAAS